MIMDAANDTRFLDFAGTAGVNDEVRRKVEAEIRENEAAIKREREKILSARESCIELSKSEKHAKTEAREMLRGAFDQRNSVAVDRGMAKTLVNNVISSSLSGNDFAQEAQKKGKEGIAEATKERLTVYAKHNGERKQRMLDLASNGKQNIAEFHDLKKRLLESKDEIEEPQYDQYLKDKAAWKARRKEKLKRMRAARSKRFEIRQNQRKQKIVEIEETKKMTAVKVSPF